MSKVACPQGGAIEMVVKKRPMRVDEYEELKWVGPCERAIKKSIEELSGGKLILIPMGYGATSDKPLKEIPVEQKIKHLDFDVKCNRKFIAIIEVSCTRYTFDGSKFFPIAAYKVRDENSPIYYVYSLELEPYDLPKRCWWITKENAMKNLLQKDLIWLQTKRPGGPKRQLNYLTNKHSWTQGLQSIVNELLKLC